MTCVNLLRLNEQRRNEHLLTEKFDEASLACTTPVSALASSRAGVPAVCNMTGSLYDPCLSADLLPLQASSAVTGLAVHSGSRA